MCPLIIASGPSEVKSASGRAAPSAARRRGGEDPPYPAGVFWTLCAAARTIAVIDFPPHRTFLFTLPIIERPPHSIQHLSTMIMGIAGRNPCRAGAMPGSVLGVVFVRCGDSSRLPGPDSMGGAARKGSRTRHWESLAGQRAGRGEFQGKPPKRV